MTMTDTDNCNSREYNDFVDKFKPRKTTDDCMTPPDVYAAVLDWAAKEYGFDPATACRPFYPGGDYTRFDYTGRVVVDNPPFSILSQIVNWYMDRDIRFFLFAPGLTTFAAAERAAAERAAATVIDLPPELAEIQKTLGL